MARFGVKEVADVVFYDLVTGKPVLFLDSLKMSNLENEAETSYLTGGKGNARILAFDFNRTATFQLQDALMNPKSIAMQAGAEVVKGMTVAHKREVLNVSGGAVTFSKSPVTGSVVLYETTDGYEHGDEATVSVTGTTGTVTTSATKVIAYYQYETGADTETIKIASDKYAGFYKVVGQTVVRNASTGVDEPFEVEVPKAKITSTFAINMQPDGDPAVFDMALDVFKDDESTDMVLLKLIK